MSGEVRSVWRGGILEVHGGDRAYRRDVSGGMGGASRDASRYPSCRRIRGAWDKTARATCIPERCQLRVRAAVVRERLADKSDLREFCI